MAGSSPGSLHLSAHRGGRRDRDFVERIGDGSQMLSGQVQIDGRVPNVGVTEQFLDAGEIGAGVQKVCGETVAEGVVVLLMNRSLPRSAIAIIRSTE
jgi:hypothetical protein